MRYTPDQKKFIVSQHIRSKENIKLVKLFFEREFGVKAPKTETIRAIVTKWKTHGTIHHVKGKSGRPRSSRNQRNVDRVRETFESNPGLSLRRGAQILEVPQTSLRRILKEDLGFTPYKVLERHHLPEKSIERRVEGSENLLEAIKCNPQMLSNFWFSDEAQFELVQSSKNSQNNRNWCAKPPNIIVERKAHPQKTMVWAAISAKSKFE